MLFLIPSGINLHLNIDVLVAFLLFYRFFTYEFLPFCNTNSLSQGAVLRKLQLFSYPHRQRVRNQLEEPPKRTNQGVCVCVCVEVSMQGSFPETCSNWAVCNQHDAFVLYAHVILFISNTGYRTHTININFHDFVSFCSAFSVLALDPQVLPGC